MHRFIEQIEDFQALQLSIVLTNPEREITFVNAQFTELTGYTLNEVVGKNCSLLQGPDTDLDEIQRLKISIKKGQAYQGELLNYRKDGSVFWNEFNVTPITNDKGEIVQFFSIQRDVTDKKHLADQLKASDQSFYTLANGSPMMISLSGLDKKSTWFNKAWKRYTGIESSQTITNAWKTDIHPDDLFRVIDIYSSYFDQTQPFCLEYRLRHHTGEYRWIESQSVPRFDAKGLFIGYITYCQDVTEARQANVANDFFNYSREMVYSTDINGIILDINDRFVAVTGYERRELIGEHIRIIKSGLHDASFYKMMWHNIMTVGSWSGEVTNRTKDGAFYSAVSTVTRIEGKNGTFERYLAIASDITVIIEKRQQLEHLAYYDVLTGFPNRLLLSDRIQQAISYVKRTNKFLAVLFLDFDGFKAINDYYGHDAGDTYLVVISRAISNVIRESDTLARLGGDEFVILLNDIAQISDIVMPLNKILAACSQSVPFKNHELRASASIGCALFSKFTHNQDLNAQALLHRADQAMYVAKKEGKNRYHIFDEETNSQVNTITQLISELQVGIERNEFSLQYQPKVNMRTGILIGVEALIRWHHPEHGLLQPDKFLPLIDAHHLNIELGEWVMKTAFAQLKQWQSAGLKIPISINIHPNQVLQHAFTQSVQKLLASYPAYVFGSLEIEILETDMIHHVDKVRKAILDCQAMGVSFALDDFGTGYSSLNLLRALPAKTIKIDRSYVSSTKVFNNVPMLESICYLANKLGYDLIAEGVETLEQGKTLIEVGCEHAQGFAIANPMPADEIPTWQRNWKPPQAWTVALTQKAL